MSRYIFTPQGVSNLKTSINQTVNAIDNLYWLSRAVSYLQSNSTEENILTSIDTEVASSMMEGVERFKPSHAKLLNSVAAIFGYRTFKELSDVANKQAPNDRIVVGTSEYFDQLNKLFFDLAVAHFDASEQANYSFDVFASYLVSAWELNKNLAPKRNSRVMLSMKRDSFNQDDPIVRDIVIELSDGVYTISNELVGELDRCVDETYNGSLLPTLARFSAEDAQADGKIGALLVEHTMRVSGHGISGNGELVGVNMASCHAESQMYWAENLHNHNGQYTSVTNHTLSQIWKHASPVEVDVLLGTNRNVFAERLLAFIVGLQPFHRNHHEKNQWFFKPCTKEERLKMLTGEKISTIKPDSKGRMRWVKNT